MEISELKGTLQQRIQATIDKIAAVADLLPGVIIIHDNTQLSVLYMSKRGTDILGISLEELIAMKAEYHEKFFNPEEASIYVPKIISLLERNNPDEWISFFQQVRPSPKH